MSRFKITSKKGFHVTFANGWTVSVQFGPGNYCDNYDRDVFTEDEACGKEGSSTAECAFWSSEGYLQPFGDGEPGDTVKGHMSADEVLALMNEVAARESK